MKSWNATELSEMMRQYQVPCVLLAACELELFSVLEGGAKDAAAVAGAIQGDLRGTTTLLDALVALEILEKKAGRYSLASGVAPVLGTGGAMLAMAQHQANCLRSWSELARVAKTGRPNRKEASVRGEAADYASFIEAMDNVSRITAQPLVDALPELRFNHLLDVGGASGTWTIDHRRAPQRQ